MLTLKQIKKDIQFNNELSELVEILKDIASAQFRHVQVRKEYSARFSLALNSFFPMVEMIKSRHLFLAGRQDLPGAIVMITSDEGFLGGLNSQVIDAGLSLRETGDNLVVLGERGAHSLEELKESFLYFPGIPEEIDYNQAGNLRDYLIQQYLSRKVGRVTVIYPKFISFSLNETKTEQLLPYAGKTDNVIPDTDDPSSAVLHHRPEILVEPSEGRIIDYLIRVWMAQKIYDIFWESKLSELSSRVMHLEGSSRTLGDLSKKFNLDYFRTLHSISDKNIREIIASRLIK